MNKRLITGFLLGMLVSGIAFAVSSDGNKDFTINKDVKIEIQQASKGIANGRIMIKIDGRWYRFEQQPYVKLTK